MSAKSPISAAVGARKKKPLSLNKVLNREIKPVLNRCLQCGKPKAEHVKAEVDHKYRRDERLPEWQGWHAFRRGLATNLHDLGRATQQCLGYAEVLH